MSLSKRELIIMKISKGLVDAFLQGKRNEVEIMTNICKQEKLTPDETITIIDDVTEFTVKENEKN